MIRPKLVNTQKKIGIVIPTFGRSAYVKQCFDSLRQSNLTNCILCIVDESSALPMYKEIDGCTLFTNVDSAGFDLYKCHQGEDISKEGMNDSQCIGFNEAGWLKFEISKTPTWIMESYFSLYIKNDYLEVHPEISNIYTKESFVADKLTTQLVNEFKIDGVPIIKIQKKIHQNMYDSIKQGFDLLSKLCDTLMVLDSDTIHKKVWVESIYELHIKLQSLEVPTITSGFNTDEHRILKCFDNFAFKNSLGGCNMCMSVDTYRSIVRPSLTSVAWDHEIKDEMTARKGIYACTIPSVIQHIGVEGLWSNRDRFDQASDF